MNRLTLAILFTAFIAFPLGLAVGFGFGVYSTEFGKELLAVATSEELPADVANPKAVRRDHFELKYPANWSLARNDEDFDIDQYFSIDTPGYSYVLFEIYPVDTSPQDNVQDSTKYFNKLLRVSKTTSFDRWGKYSGAGVRLVGEYVGEPVEVRLFSHTSGERSFTVTEFFDTAKKQHVEPGYNLVEATFELRSAEAENPVEASSEKKADSPSRRAAN